MDPIRDTHATLVDLLDRILSKGILLNTDLIISVAGVPLLGINLKACLAGMETMLKYGIWQDWDEAQRAFANEEQKLKKNVPLLPDEEIYLSVFASLWYNKGIYHNWRPGYLYITNKRVFIFRKEPAEMLFECSYEEIRCVSTDSSNNIAGEETDNLYLLLGSGTVTRLHANDVQTVKNAININLNVLGLELDETISIPVLDEIAEQFLSSEEQVLYSGKISHLVAESGAENTIKCIWKVGHLYLTSRRLAWWYDFGGKIAFEVNTNKILDIVIKGKDRGDILKNESVLELIYDNNGKNLAISFSGTVEEMDEWQKKIDDTVCCIKTK
jgi:hypothetical protein